MPTKYLFIFAQVHHEFRIPEILSVAELNGFNVVLPGAPDDLDITRPFMILGLYKEDHAVILAKRCILVKSIYEFYAQGSSYEELHIINRVSQPQWSPYAAETSFKFLVTAYKHTIPPPRQRDVMESFGYMSFLGKIDMKNPQILLGCFEEYEGNHGTTRDLHQVDGQFRQVYFGRLVAEGSARSLISTFDVKKRVYYGNTSMEAEISLIMANQALAAPGRLVYDPFMGTGSMAYPVSHFGALIFGSDIDGRQMRGKGKPVGVLRAAAQYGVASRVLDLCTFDVTRNPWRCGELFDAIITDPPYGVRAGAKRLGRKKELSLQHQTAYLERQAAPKPDQPYIPPTKPYELSQLATDLVILARYLLKPGGRLVFFLPTVTDEYEEVDIQTMLCEGMEVVANSLQDFGSWGRRLVTMRKTTSDKHLRPLFDGDDEAKTHTPAHKDFRLKYFQGFKNSEKDSQI